MFKKRNLVLSAYFIFLLTPPFTYSSLYSLLVVVPGCLISLISLILIIRYLNSLPNAQRTVSNYLHVQACFLFFPFLLREIIIVVLVNMFYGSTKASFEANPNLMCSLTNGSMVFIPLNIILICMVASKLCLFVFPLHFVGLNHELLGNLALAITLLISFLEPIVKLLYYKTLCTEIWIERLTWAFNFQVDIESKTLLETFDLRMIFVSAGMTKDLCSVSSYAVNFYRQKKRGFSLVAKLVLFNHQIILGLLIDISINILDIYKTRQDTASNIKIPAIPTIIPGIQEAQGIRPRSEQGQVQPLRGQAELSPQNACSFRVNQESFRDAQINAGRNNEPFLLCELPLQLVNSELRNQARNYDLTNQVIDHDLPNQVRDYDFPNLVSNCNLPNQVSDYDLPNHVSNCNLPNQVSHYDLPNQVSSCNLPNQVSDYDLPNHVSNYDDLANQASNYDFPSHVSHYDLPSQVSNYNLSNRVSNYELSQSSQNTIRFLPDSVNSSDGQSFTNSSHRSPVRVVHVLFAVHIVSTVIFRCTNNHQLKFAMKFLTEVAFRLDICIFPLSMLILNDKMYEFSEKIVAGWLCKIFSWRYWPQPIQSFAQHLDL